ncbi:MAG TPA: maleylpyruvate isomerase N-terminal domain-containing protein, partial [Streptosporangiaceae bacterium]
MDLHQEMAAAAAEDARVVGSVTPGQLTMVTPCTDWDLRTLLNHTILWTAYSAERRARDEPLPDGLTETDFVARPEDAERADAEQTAAAWRDALAREGLLPGGDRADLASQVVALYAYVARTP